MAVLGSIVEAFVRPVFDARNNLAFGCAVGSEFVGDETLRRSPLLLHQPEQQTFRSFLIASTFKNFIQYNAILTNIAPQPELPAFDLHNNFVQMPNVARSGLSAAQSACDGGAELRNSSTDSFVRGINPTFQKHLFNLTKTEVETTIKPGCMSDDCWRKTVALVTD